MLKKVIALLLSLALLCSCLVACSTSNTATTTADPAEAASDSVSESADDTATESVDNEESTKYADHYMGIAWPMMSSEFFVNYANTIVERCESWGMKTELVSADGDAAKQIEQLENLAQMGITDLIVCAVNEEAIKDTLKSLRKDYGIKVTSFAYNFGGDEDCYDIVLYASNYMIGTAMGEVANDYINKTWPDAGDGEVKVAMIEYPHSNEDIDRDQGAKDTLLTNPKVEIVYEYELASYEGSEAQNALDIILMQEPDTDIVICHNANHATAVDERALMHPELDKATFGIISGDDEQEIYRRMIMQMDGTGDSFIKGTGVYAMGGYDTICYVAMGEWTENLIDNGKTWAFPCYGVTFDNVRDYYYGE